MKFELKCIDGKPCLVFRPESVDDALALAPIVDLKEIEHDGYDPDCAIILDITNLISNCAVVKFEPLAADPPAETPPEDKPEAETAPLGADQGGGGSPGAGE